MDFNRHIQSLADMIEDREKTIKRLREELKAANGRIAELEKVIEEMPAVCAGLNVDDVQSIADENPPLLDPKWHIITDAQIDILVGIFEGLMGRICNPIDGPLYGEEETREAFYGALGIKRCEGCDTEEKRKTHAILRQECPDCLGRGWVKEE